MSRRPPEGGFFADASSPRTYFITRRVMRCGQDGPYARRTAQAICRYGQAGQRRRRRAAGRSRGPDVLPGMRPRRCASTRSNAALWPAPGSHLRVYTRRHCSAVRVPWPQPEWDGAESNGPLPLLSALGQVNEAQATSACSGAHLFVGRPRNIDILLRALLLDLHPTSPPSHTRLVMK